MAPFHAPLRQDYVAEEPARRAPQPRPPQAGRGEPEAAALERELARLDADLAVLRGEAAAEPPPAQSTGSCLFRPVGLEAEFGTAFVPSSRPLLSWRLAWTRAPGMTPFGADEEPPREGVQGTFQVQAAGSRAAFGNTDGDELLWDSGYVKSGDAMAEWGGDPLPSATQVFWRVRVWDAADRSCSWSSVAEFETTLLHHADWRGARWLERPGARGSRDHCELFENNPAPLFRAEFAVPADFVSARMYVTGLGYYEAEIGGRRVGDHRLDPGWTKYDRRVLFSTYDITPLLVTFKGATAAVGVRLANGWWNLAPLRFWASHVVRRFLASGTPRFILSIRALLPSGETQELVSTSDPRQWRTAGSETLRNDVFLGERISGLRARELQGWSSVGFDDSLWQHPETSITEVGSLHGQAQPPVRRRDRRTPVSVNETSSGTFLVDMGHNRAGSCEFTLTAPAGEYAAVERTWVQVVYGELLWANGTLNSLTSTAGQVKCNEVPMLRRISCPLQPCTAEQTDEYLPEGPPSEAVDGWSESFAPRWTFKGFRYMRISGWPKWANKPLKDSIKCWALSSDVTRVGSVVTSNQLFNDLFETAVRTYQSNLVSVQSDCPHREKFGYTGDAVAVAESILFVFDMRGFYEKSLRDACDEQRPNGGLTETAPHIGLDSSGMGGGTGPIGWQAWMPQGVLWHYRRYGSERVVREALPCTKRFVEFLNAYQGSAIESGLGDWLAVEAKGLPMTGRMWEMLSYAAFANMSVLAADGESVLSYRSRAAAVANSINSRFLGNDGKYSGKAKEGAVEYRWSGEQTTQALALHFGIAPEEQRAAVLAVLLKNLERNCNHLQTGMWGVKWLLMALGEADCNDAAYEVMNQRTFPSHGFMLASGATTLWETWSLSESLNSHNHPMMGSHVQWLAESVCGLAPHPDAHGYDRILVRPRPPPQLEWCNATHDSARGRIAVSWAQGTHAAGQFTLRIEVPPGAVAEVHMPLAPGSTVLSADGAPVSAAARGATAVFAVAGGSYAFTASLPETRRCVRVVETPPVPEGGITLYESGGSGQLYLPFSQFTATSCTRAWDACGAGGLRFSSGGVLHSPTGGSRIASFEVTGPAQVRTGTSCYLSFQYSERELHGPYAGGERHPAGGACYFQLGGY